MKTNIIPKGKFLFASLPILAPTRASAVLTTLTTLAVLATLIASTAIYIATLENKLPYCEIWVTDSTPSKSQKESNEQKKHGKGQALLKLLESLKNIKRDTPNLPKNWNADRRYKSSFVYVESTSKKDTDAIYDISKKHFNDTIVRILPQKKINVRNQLVMKIIAILITWLLAIWIIFSNNKTIYVTFTISILIIVTSYHLHQTKAWINQLEFDVKSPYKTKKLSYSQLETITNIKSQVGELATRILEGQNYSTSFKMKSTHRLHNQKGKKTDVEKLWVRSNAPKPIIEKSIKEAELVFNTIESITKTNGKYEKNID